MEGRPLLASHPLSHLLIVGLGKKCTAESAVVLPDSSLSPHGSCAGQQPACAMSVPPSTMAHSCTQHSFLTPQPAGWPQHLSSSSLPVRPLPPSTTTATRQSTVGRMTAILLCTAVPAGRLSLTVDYAQPWYWPSSRTGELRLRSVPSQRLVHEQDLVNSPLKLQINPK